MKSYDGVVPESAGRRDLAEMPVILQDIKERISQLMGIDQVLSNVEMEIIGFNSVVPQVKEKREPSRGLNGQLEDLRLDLRDTVEDINTRVRSLSKALSFPENKRPKEKC